MIPAHSITGGATLTASGTEENYRLLVCAVLLRAWRDTRSRCPEQRTLARYWLRTSVAAGLAESVGVKLPKVVRG